MDPHSSVYKPGQFVVKRKKRVVLLNFQSRSTPPLVLAPILSYLHWQYNSQDAASTCCKWRLRPENDETRPSVPCFCSGIGPASWVGGRSAKMYPLRLSVSPAQAPCIYLRQAPFYSLRSPSIRAAPEDSLQEDLPDEIEFLSLDPPTFSERDDEDDDGDDVDSLKLEEIDEGEEDEDEEDEDDDDDDEVESNEHSSGSSSNIESLAEGDETMIDDDMKDWPEDSVDSGPADEAVHLEGLPRSTQRLPAR